VESLNTKCRTHIHKYIDLKPGDGIDCPGDGIQETVTNKECWLSPDFFKNMQKMSISLLAKQCHMGPHWP